MASPDQELQRWFDGLASSIQDELAETIREEADGLAEAIQARVRQRSGKLRVSVKVRKRKSDLDLEVVAGGDDTTKDVAAWGGEEYDYALAVEYGTTRMPAYPFFWNTVRERMPEIRQRIEGKVYEVVGHHSGSLLGNLFTAASFGRILAPAAADAFVPAPLALAAPVIELNLVDGVWRQL
jgi:hypothetical protein